MAFSNYYIKVGTYTIPLDYMQVDTYSSMPDQRQTLDSYRDADGLLHNNPISHTATKIEFETTYLYRKQMQEIIQSIKANYISSIERKVELTYYDDEIDDYKTGYFYMPGTMDYKVYNKNIYAPTRFAFIEY